MVAASVPLALGTVAAGGSSLLRCKGLERRRALCGGGFSPAAFSSQRKHDAVCGRFGFEARATLPSGAKSGRSETCASEEGKEVQVESREAVCRAEDEDSGMFFVHRTMLTVAAGMTPLLVDAPNAMAGGGEYGILEGRSLALLHPIVMGGLFLYTLYAGYLGWQWRSVRTVQEEINQLKKQVPATSPEAPAPPSPVAGKIKELTEYRKELVKGGFRDRHFNAGSILLSFGVFEAVGGAVNTWLRTGKLFPGPHLFAGAGITVLWALAASLVPAMQKGNESARTAHIALNVLNVGLFIWQIPTGLEIVWKVFEFTTWP